MPHMTTADLIGEFLIKAGVPCVASGGGAGWQALIAALKARADRIKLVPVMGDVAAVHVAEGHYRACGRPLAVMWRSEGRLGRSAFTDSTPVMIFTGGANDAASAKRAFCISKAEELPATLHRAWNAMMTGRKGPVLIHVPPDLQIASTELDVPDPAQHMPGGRPFGDSAEIDKALKLLKAANRPAILAGGGVIASEAWGELMGLAEHVGAPVVTTLMGKSAFPEDHPLCAWHTGSPGTSCGNRLTATADVLLAVGCRFADATIAPFDGRPSFATPPAKLIHVDIDPAEIGRVFPVAVGILGDAKMVLNTMLRRLRESTKPRLYVSTEYFREITRLKKEWGGLPASPLLAEVRRYLDQDAIVVTSPGFAQSQVFQQMPCHLPRTHITTGEPHADAFAVPAAIGARLARPDKKVLAITSDESAEALPQLSVVAELRLPIVVLMISRKGAKAALPDGCHAERIERPQDVRNALKRAFNSGRVAVIEASQAGAT